MPGLRKTPGGHGNPLQYSCLENPQGQRSLAGYSPRGHKELDTTERLSTSTWSYFTISYQFPVHSKVIQLYIYMCVCAHSSHVRLFATLWTVAHQGPLSVGFSRQEDCSWLPFSSPGDLPHSGIKPVSPSFQLVSLLLEYWVSLYVHVSIFNSFLLQLIILKCYIVLYYSICIILEQFLVLSSKSLLLISCVVVHIC